MGCDLCPLRGLDQLLSIAYMQMSLPLDPHDCPGTPEYRELEEERARRAYALREAMIEHDEWDLRRAHRR